MRIKRSKKKAAFSKSNWVILSSLLLLLFLISGKTAVSKEAVTTGSDSIIIENYYKKADAFTYMLPDSAFVYLKLALYHSQKSNNPRYEAKSYSKIGQYYNHNSEYENAIEALSMALKINAYLENDLEAAFCLNYLGEVYTNIGLHEKAVEQLIRSYNIFKNLHHPDGLFLVHRNLGKIYYELSDFNKSLKNYRDVLKIANEKNDLQEIAIIHRLIGNSKASLLQYDTAIMCYNKAIEINQKLNNDLEISYNLNNIGDCYMYMGNFNDALDYFSRSLIIARNLNNADMISLLNLNLADLNLRDNNFNKSILLADSSMHLAKKIGSIIYQDYLHLLLSKAYEGIQNYQMALNHYKLHKLFNDSVFRLNRARRIDAMDAVYRHEQLQIEIANLQKGQEIREIKLYNQRLIMYILIGSTLILGFLILFLIRNIRIRNRAFTLIANQKTALDKHIADKDTFYSIIAHDLKGPVNSLLGFSEIILMDYDSSQQKNYKRFIQILYESSKRLNDLLENLLLWSKNQSEKLTYKPETINIQTIISEIISLNELQLKSKDITIDTTLKGSNNVYADPNMIHTILRNLIANAIKFSEPLSKIRIHYIRTENDFTIHVIDSGQGIPEKYIPKLFTADQTALEEIHQGKKGSGLGLKLCHDFVTKHKGEIKVNSKLDEGSDFYFTIPQDNLPITQPDATHSLETDRDVKIKEVKTEE